MTIDRLIVLLGGQVIGEVRRDRDNKWIFVYDDAWRENPNAVPLSLSMPLASSRHDHRVIEAFVWGLLPDNATILDRWARRFQVSPRNPFALIAHVGEDCAGAAQFIPPERLDAVTASAPPAIDWIDEDEVARRLRALKTDHAAWRALGDNGQFSLAGAQPKIAFLYENGRWGIPSGRTPTTHIIKPQIGEFDGHAINEHVCMEVARALGLSAAPSRARRFDDEWVIVVERYDRAYTSALAAAESAKSAAYAAEAAEATARPDAFEAARKAAELSANAAASAANAKSLSALAQQQPILRLHQEDMCQALGLPPVLKYQNEGGPSPKDIRDVLVRNSGSPGEDVLRFVDALALNWLIGGTDGHAKNYALLHGARRVRLAPLYDVASILPYADVDIRRAKLAMRIGKEYGLVDVGPRQWRTFAKDLALDADVVADRVQRLAEDLPDAVFGIARRLARDGLTHPIVDRLAQALAARARSCASEFV